MGSAAIFFYGFCIEKKLKPAWTEDYTYGLKDWEDQYAKKKGLGCPKEGYPGGRIQSKRAKKLRAQYKKYWRDTSDLIKKEPCCIFSYCCAYDPKFCIAVKKSIVMSERVEKVESLKVKNEWEKQLKEFCEILNIPLPEEFSWHLVLYWE